MKEITLKEAFEQKLWRTGKLYRYEISERYRVEFISRGTSNDDKLLRTITYGVHYVEGEFSLCAENGTALLAE